MQISQETTEVLDICDLYQEGKMNLREAGEAIQDFTGLDFNTAKQFLYGLDRDNVVKFPNK
jgi:hypothetical protein